LSFFDAFQGYKLILELMWISGLDEELLTWIETVFSCFREYWLNLFEGSVDKYASRAVNSQPDSATAKQRGEFFKEKFVTRLRELREQPL